MRQIMKRIRKLLYYLINEPSKIAIAILIRTAILIPDKIYLRCLFRLRVGYKLNLKNPTSFNEKLQWLKIYNRHNLQTKMVDKAEVKKYVAELIGEEYIIPTIAVYDTPDQIDFESLPNQFVLKCTHDSGGVVVCKDKSTLNKDEVRAKFGRWLKTNYFYQNREWPYKNVKPRIIAEQYMEDESGYELKDYKWFCFNGEPKVLFIAADRGMENEETKFDFYDMDFNHLPFTNGHPNASKLPRKPKGFDQMKELAAKLSVGEPHVRVDFYDINGCVYFGELTFYHWSGMVPFEPQEWDYIFGSWIKIQD